MAKRGGGKKKTGEGSLVRGGFPEAKPLPATNEVKTKGKKKGGMK